MNKRRAACEKAEVNQKLDTNNQVPKQVDENNKISKKDK